MHLSIFSSRDILNYCIFILRKYFDNVVLLSAYKKKGTTEI